MILMLIINVNDKIRGAKLQHNVNRKQQESQHYHQVKINKYEPSTG